MGIVVMWLPLTASSRPLSGLRCTEVVLWSLTVSKALVVSVFGGVVTIIAGAYRTARMYVSDGTDASFGRYESSCRPIRVARGGQQLRGGTLQFRRDALQLRQGTLQFCRDALQLRQGTLQLRQGTLQLRWDVLQAGWGASASCGDDGGEMELGLGCARDGLGNAWDGLGCARDGLGNTWDDVGSA